MIAELSNLPDISFIDGETLSDLEAAMVAAYEEKFEEETGEAVTLGRTDPETILLYSCAVVIYQMYLNIDKGAKMNLLKYAYGDYLDNLGALKGVTRLPASAAITTIRFTISEVRDSSTSIPAATRVTADGSLFFETDEYAEIPAGEEYIDVPATCATTGTAGNGYRAREINILSDPIAYIASVENIDASSGGTETESDDDLRERIFIAPSSYSTTGPLDAYLYWIKNYNSSIADAEITSDEDAVVQIRPIMDGGALPEESLIEGLQEYLESEQIRPLTDKVVVSAPDTREYSIALTYYINQSDASKAVTIQANVASAIADYVAWQSEKIGRDINPSELTSRVIAAGAKRVEITSPEFTIMPKGTIAVAATQTVTYGGLEHD